MRMRLRSKVVRAAFTSVVFLLAVGMFADRAANATPLPPGGTIYPTSSTPPVVGTIVAGGIPVPFSSGLYSGTLTSTVLSGDPGNSLGGLTFVYQLTNSAGTDPIERLTLNDFGTFAVDATYVAASGLVPTLFDRSIGTLGTSFIAAPVGPGKLTPGSTSAILVFRTSAPGFTGSFASVIDGTVTTVPSFAPFSTIPEPSTLALVGVGAAGCFALRRRRS